MKVLFARKTVCNKDLTKSEIFDFFAKVEKMIGEFENGLCCRVEHRAENTPVFIERGELRLFDDGHET